MAADNKALGVDVGRLMVNGELMHEAADEFEKAIKTQAGLTSTEVNLLRETLWHALQRADVPDEDKSVMHQLYFKMDGTPSRSLFKDKTEELHFHLIRAENHAQSAQKILYAENPGSTKRSVWFRMALNRAQSILIKLYTRDINRKK